MIFTINPFQMLAVEMGVDLGGGDISMTEHLLDRAKIGSTFDQMGGERVPKDMG